MTTPVAKERCLSAGPWKLTFRFEVDRWCHELAVQSGKMFRPVLRSVEGTPEDDWPPSPAFQELDIFAGASGEIALLVGRAGQSHWSASIEPDAGSGQVVFDIACRMNRPAAMLGSTYKILFVSGWQFTPLPVPEGTLAIDQDETRLELRTAAAFHEFPSTVRWKYAVKHR